MFVLHKRVVYSLLQNRITITESAINTEMVPEYLEPAGGYNVNTQKPQPASISPQLTAEVCHCDTQTNARIKAVSAAIIPEYITVR
jgi:hypothetical protein